MDSRQHPHKDRSGAAIVPAAPEHPVPGLGGGLPEGLGEPASAVGAAGARQPVRDGESLVSVTGYVLPDAWGDNYEVSGVLIADDRERELVVGNVADHPALLTLCRRKVTATGRLAARDGRLLFTVRDFMVVDAAG